MSARDNILGRIRAVTGGGGAAAVTQRLATHPRGPQPPMDFELRSHFVERCRLLSSTVHEVEGLTQVPAALAAYLESEGLPRRAVCWPRFAGLDWGSAGIAMDARPARGDDLVGMTGAFCGIAETGTLLLLSGPDTHPVTSLLPETHVAVLEASRLTRCMEDAWDLVRRETPALPRQMAFVSGPSRTADIELTLVLGVHGPYRVHIIVLTGA